MYKRWFLLFLLISISLVSALNVNVPVPINYSAIVLNTSSNDSFYHQGLTPQQVADLFNELDPRFSANLTSGFSSNLFPSTTLTYDLGSGTNRWNNTYTAVLNSEIIDNLNNITTGQYFIGSGAYLGDLNITGDITGYTLNISYLSGHGGIGVMDLRGDPWYLGGVSLEVNGNVTAQVFNGEWNGSSNYVPYIGATTDVDLGGNNLISFGVETTYITGGTGDPVVDMINGYLVADDQTTTILDFSTDGTADFIDNNLTTTGTGSFRKIDLEGNSGSINITPHNPSFANLNTFEVGDSLYFKAGGNPIWAYYTNGFLLYDNKEIKFGTSGAEWGRIKYLSGTDELYIYSGAGDDILIDAGSGLTNFSDNNLTTIGQSTFGTANYNAILGNDEDYVGYFYYNGGESETYIGKAGFGLDVYYSGGTAGYFDDGVNYAYLGDGSYGIYASNGYFDGDVEADSFTEHSNIYPYSIGEAKEDLSEWISGKHPVRFASNETKAQDIKDGKSEGETGTDIGKSGKATASLSLSNDERLNLYDSCLETSRDFNEFKLCIGGV